MRAMAHKSDGSTGQCVFSLKILVDECRAFAKEQKRLSREQVGQAGMGRKR